jgi:beta-aspartyl-peptidase (threonine type)
MYGLAIHGGAGTLPRLEMSVDLERLYRAGLVEALNAGYAVLDSGGSSLDAVTSAVVRLEDNPLFNAGHGAVFTLDGRNELDASIMDGATLKAGAVCGVMHIKNPIELARAVMERTPHLLMGGAGAERIARQAGLALCQPNDLVSPRARERWLAARELIGRPSPSDQFAADAHGTVGAVALDSRGDIAAATSTGGVSGKLPGRIGDSAIIGAGLFADGHGGASATGEGEAIMRVALCREAVVALSRIRPRERMKGSAQAAAERTIAMLSATTGAQAGVILVDSRGELGYAHSAEVMELAMFHPDQGFRHRVAEPLIKSDGKSRQPRG